MQVKKYYTDNRPKGWPHFPLYDWNQRRASSMAQEALMRSGIEARALEHDPSDVSDLECLANVVLMRSLSVPRARGMFNAS